MSLPSTAGESVALHEQACDFRDHYDELLDSGASRVFGVSSQDRDYQREVAERLRLPFTMLSDTELSLAEQLALPTFRVGALTLFKRLTLVIRDGVIEHAFYPIFPPNDHARQVLAWLQGPHRWAVVGMLPMWQTREPSGLWTFTPTVRVAAIRGRAGGAPF
ncbi:MAG: peroxiredoxin [Pseudonocardiaceae bacterium]